PCNKSGWNAPVGRTGTHEPAGWTTCTTTTSTEPHHAFRAGNDKGACAAHYRRCRFICTASTPTLCCGQNQEFRVADHTRSRTLRLLGTTGRLQSRCAGIYPQALMHREKKQP